MPKAYESMRDKFFAQMVTQGMPTREALEAAQAKAAKIYNSQRKPGARPVGRKG